MNLLFSHLVAEVDTKLFKSIEIKDLEASNIQDTNEGDPLHLRVDQGLIAPVHQVSEQLLKQRPGNG